VDLYERYSEVLRDKAKDRGGDRSPVAKDRDRIIHSGALRRLQRKSQIVGVQSNDFFRTRLTHTLECAQIGRAIALRVSRAGQTDLTTVVADAADLPDLIEAACLAHDLGHPPFGHNGELALQVKMGQHAEGSFEGNAQSMRIVTRLEPKVYHGEPLGLDLCATTLRAIVKYPRTEAYPSGTKYPKFCFYKDETELDLIGWLYPEAKRPYRELADKPNIAALMLEAADDIAYAVHDFEDGVWSGMIPLWQLLQEVGDARERLDRRVKANDKKVLKVKDIPSVLDRLFGEVKDQSWASQPFDRRRRSRAELKNFCAIQIGHLIEGVTPNGKFTEKLPKAISQEIELLKAIAWEWMIEDPSQEMVRYGQRQLVEKLFDGFWDNPLMLPTRESWVELQDRSSDMQLGRGVWAEKARLVCDHIAGMTDLYALHVYNEMFGGGGAPNLRLI
jgi:dGTPase